MSVLRFINRLLFITVFKYGFEVANHWRIFVLFVMNFTFIKTWFENICKSVYRFKFTYKKYLLCKRAFKI